MASRLRRIDNCLTAALALLLVSGASQTSNAADDEVARAEAAIEKQSAASNVGYSSNLGGYQLRWNPYLETEGGYDSNPDNRFSEPGSSFIKTEAGLKATLQNAREYYALTVKGRFIDYPDLANEIQHRTDFKVALDTSYELSPTETLRSGSYFLRDLISLARADVGHSYLEYTKRGDDYRFKIQSRTHVEHNFDNDIDNLDPFFSATRAKAFDFIRSDGQVNVLIFTRNMLQPFLIYDFGDINYYNQTTGALIDRDAREQFGIAGVRLQFSERFRIDVGYRINDRDLDDAKIRHASSDFVDINLYWQPVDTFKFTAIVERYYDETDTLFGRVDDVETYGITLDWTIMPKWRLAGTLFYDRQNALGGDDLRNKITSTLSLTYDANDHLEYFLSGLGKWVTEEFKGDDYERYKIGAGTRIKF